MAAPQQPCERQCVTIHLLSNLCVADQCPYQQLAQWAESRPSVWPIVIRSALSQGQLDICLWQESAQLASLQVQRLREGLWSIHALSCTRPGSSLLGWHGSASATRRTRRNRIGCSISVSPVHSLQEQQHFCVAIHLMTSRCSMQLIWLTCEFALWLRVLL